MEILRGIFDQADVGLVIAGAPALAPDQGAYLAATRRNPGKFLHLPREALSGTEVRLPREYDIDRGRHSGSKARALATARQDLFPALRPYAE